MTEASALLIQPDSLLLHHSTLNKTSMGATNNDTAVPARKILFVTNSESGQSNTILAMALETTTRSHVEAHVASFPSLKRRVESLSPKINFHPLDGMSIFETAAARGLSEDRLPHPPTTKSYKPYGQSFVIALTGWDGECASRFLLRVWVVTDVLRLPGSAYVRICDSIKKIIEGINPDIVVVDSLFNPGFDACYSLNCRFVMSTSNTPMDIERPHLPWLKWLWYYPVFVLPIWLPSSH